MPVRGRAVQGPMVSAPISVPRVVVIQVAPTPTTVASSNAVNVMRISRTGYDQFLRGADEPAFPAVSAA